MTHKPVLGIVSNCWGMQLEQGQSVERLVDQAVQRGFCAIELRQGSLGEFETTLEDPNQSGLDRLARLSRRFSTVEFDVAISHSCFGDVLPDERLIANGLALARAVAGDQRPHLRIVDTQTKTRHLADPARQAAAIRIADITRKLIPCDGCLSVEHAWQAWSDFWSVMERAKELLAFEASRLRCCFDPCNLLLSDSVEAVAEIVGQVKPCDVSMIHIKQKRDGRILPDLSAGDLDWNRLLRLLQQNGHAGPWLFEVASDLEIWQNLEQSAGVVLAAM